MKEETTRTSYVLTILSFSLNASEPQMLVVM